MNEGFGKEFYRKGNSVKRSGRFSEPPDSEIEKLLSSSPSRKSALIYRREDFSENQSPIIAALMPSSLGLVTARTRFCLILLTAHNLCRPTQTS